MRVAVYSGTFNPLHEGHRAIISYLAGCGDFDEVRLVVSPHSPFKYDASSDGTEARRRLDAVRAALASEPISGAVIDDVEYTLPSPQYTIRTLDLLKSREPGNTFVLAMGGDCLESIRRWKDYQRILLDYGAIVYPRPGFDSEALRDSLIKENPGYRINLISGVPLMDISSTRVREESILQ